MLRTLNSQIYRSGMCPPSPSTQVCDRMPKANMLRGMLSYLQGEGNLVTQAQANEVGGWEKCGEHCQCDPIRGRRGVWLGKLWGKCGGVWMWGT